jgi:hypothetical protein
VLLRISSDDAGIQAARVALRRAGDVWRARSAAIAVSGVWDMVVFVDRGADSVEIPLAFHTRCRARSASDDTRPRIYDIDLPDGGSVQAYADPGAPGRNEVHFTFFDELGKELPMADDPRIAGLLEKPKELDVRRFSAGHFVAGAELKAGLWTFDFVGETTTREAVNVCFSDEIR